MRLQALVQAMYPPQCLCCDTPVDRDFALCGPCWRDTPLVAGLVCDACGAPLPGADDGGAVLCDDCLSVPRPWSRGRAAMVYGGNARRMILQLKHGDRLDLARPLGDWLARAAGPLIVPGMIVAPVPLHWLRLLKRRANQSALLAARVARVTGLPHVPDLLIRHRATASQGGKGREARMRNVADAIRPHPRRIAAVRGRPVLLIDDVMTSGATLTVATESLLSAGVAQVSVLVLARAARDA